MCTSPTVHATRREKCRCMACGRDRAHDKKEKVSLHGLGVRPRTRHKAHRMACSSGRVHIAEDEHRDSKPSAPDANHDGGVSLVCPFVHSYDTYFINPCIARAAVAFYFFYVDQILPYLTPNEGGVLRVLC